MSTLAAPPRFAPVRMLIITLVALALATGVSLAGAARNQPARETVTRSAPATLVPAARPATAVEPQIASGSAVSGGTPAAVDPPAAPAPPASHTTIVANNTSGFANAEGGSADVTIDGSGR